MLKVCNLVKIYKPKKSPEVRALNNVSIDFGEKGLVFLLGKSGSGKSTLLNAIGGLDKFDSGEIIIKGKSSKEFTQNDFDSYRNTFIGFIFQDYNILEEFTVEKNIELAIELQGKVPNKDKVENLLEQVDIKDYAKRKPNELSGGQKQRVAIARALIKNPEIIMADEPTGALDSNTGKQVMETLKKLSKDKLVIVVSHDREFAELYGDRIIELKDGEIISDVTKKEMPTKSFNGIKVIDKNLIYIKKGQDVQDKDLEVIKKIIKANSKYKDTFISLDENSNEKIKECSKINENGNKESFGTTNAEDIKTQNYNGKDFKLIKSKLKAKDSFKMGASALKYKKVKLFFTILLSCIAFAMFGIIDTFSSYNKGVSAAETISSMGCKTISVMTQKQIKSYDNYDYTDDILLSRDNLQYLNNTKNQKFYPVTNIDYNETYVHNLNQNNSSQSNEIYKFRISGAMVINNNILSDLGLNLIEGSLPTDENEICITKTLFISLKNSYEGVDNLNSLTEKNCLIGGRKIVGIIDDKTDISKYTNQTNGSDLQSMMFYQEIDLLQRYGVSNLMFIHETAFDKIQNNIQDNKYISHNSSIYLTMQIPYYYDENLKEQITNSINYSYYYTAEEKNQKIKEEIDKIYSEIQYKQGKNINNLSDNEVVLSRETFNNYFSDKTIEEALNEDTIIKIYNSYYKSEDDCYEFKLAGVISDEDYHFNSIIMNPNTFNNTAGGYKFAVASSGTQNQIKDLYKNFSKNKDVDFVIQSPATTTINSFASIIKTAAKVLVYFAIGFAIFSSILLANFIATSISYKKREIGVLRAIGARGIDVFKIFFFESLIIALINFVFASVITGTVCIIINNVIIKEIGLAITLLSFGIKQIILMLIISVIVAIISSYLPVRKIAKKNPIDAIRNR